MAKDKPDAAQIAARRPIASGVETDDAELIWTDPDGTVWEYRISADGTCLISGISPAVPSLAVPESIEGRAVAAIAPEACTNSTSLRELFIPPSVCSIGWKAFAYSENLRQLTLSEGLEELDGFAFMYAGIDRLKLPSTLRRLGEKAFYACESLASAVLNEGLESIGESAFAMTAVSELRIPASVSHIGARVLQPKDPANVVRVFVDEGNPRFLSDAEGFGTYRRLDGADVASGSPAAADGSATAVNADETSAAGSPATADELCANRTVGLELLEYRGNQPAYDVLPGTREIGPRAFALQRSIETVVLPEGLAAISEEAFKGCRALRRVNLPASLAVIGPRAFFECGLRDLRLPAGLQEVDDSSFMVNGNPTTRGKRHPLRIEVDPANPRFFVHTGVLTQHLEDGTDRAIIYTDSASVVEIPQTTRHLGQHLFFGASAIDELYIHDGIASFGSQAFGVLFPIGHIHMTLTEPLEGRSELDFYFGRSASLSLNFIQVFRDGLFDARELLQASDQAMYFMSNRFRRAKLMLRRLGDPFLLPPETERKMRKIIRESLTAICVSFAERRYNEGIAQLFDLGFVDEDNVDDLAERVHATGSVSSSAYLLEMKRRRFGTTAFSEYDI